jgi:hypothetical protein
MFFLQHNKMDDIAEIEIFGSLQGIQIYKEETKWKVY